ncbi:MAG: epoxyqueuosine reductase QueH [Nitrospirales bacterium]|nr:epoxyqueuosine reductase QueH [Nitrospirales bacterium]
MKILMHLCCANCALYPITSLRQKGVEITGLWFNPNIHPFTEYSNRLNAVRELQRLWGLEVEYEGHYGLTEYLRNVVGREKERCGYCYTVRLEETAKRAREMGMDAFSTSLLVSPFQKFDMIKTIGAVMQERYDIEFLGEDFRPGFSEGKRLSRELGLYRQKYCGCIYSEMERFAPAEKES